MVSIDTHWKQLLWDCYHHGHSYRKDDAQVKELLGNYVFLERPQDIDIPIHEKVDNLDVFMDRMKKGLYNLQGYPLKNEALADYVNSFNKNSLIYCSDDESREKLHIETIPFVYTYPERLLHMPSSDEFIDQFDIIASRLRKNQGSNRAVATLYQPFLDGTRTDIPCLNWLQATIRDDKLELHCIFRSNDLFGAWPSNMYLLTFLGLWLVEELQDPNLTFNGIHYHSSSLHIYEIDLSTVKEVLGE